MQTKEEKKETKTEHTAPTEQNQPNNNYFGFDVRKFYGDVYNAMIDYGDYLVKDLRDLQFIIPKDVEYIRRKSTSTDTKEKPIDNQAWLEKSLRRIQNNIHRAIDTSFDAFEMYSHKNVFLLPPHLKPVLLQKQEEVAPEQLLNEEELSVEEQKLHQEILELRQKISEERQKNQILIKEGEFLKSQNNFFEKHKQKLEVIEEACNKEDVESIKDLISQVISEGSRLIEKLKDIEDVHLQDKSVSREITEMDEEISTLANLVNETTE